MSSDNSLHPGGIIPVDALHHAEDMEWLNASTLCVVVVGASGDLAKKKTYPSLLNLYDDNLLPRGVRIYGFARSDLSDDDLRDRLRPYLEKEGEHSKEVIDRFLNRCFYHGGNSYGDVDAFEELQKKMKEYEDSHFEKYGEIKHANRLFYFAIPPSVFADTALAIKKTSMQDEEKGWTRLIVEKPFGRDLESFEELNKTLAEHFTEDHLYRIDHYLGKELVQNVHVLRFSNIWFERVWNTQNIQCVILTFKEPFGTEGRGGYFDKYGIIRDICQNHLLQVLTLLAMETPTFVEGPKASKSIRDAKVNVLHAIPPIALEDVVLGQYEGYRDDPTIENKDTNCPTFATLLLRINTPRWQGVPFIMKAGKALNERKAEIRVQFKDAPAADFLFQGEDCPRNELVMRMQPHEAIYLKTNVKSPGFGAKPVQSELEVNYDTRFYANQKESNPDAYTRLILDVLQGRHESFVRDDELRRAWEIFTPLLHQIDEQNVRPILYKQGTRGPREADEFIANIGGYIRNEDYVFYEGNVARKTEGTNVAPSRPKIPMKELSEEQLCDVGVFGLSVMGMNLALNMAENGFKVAVGNRSYSKVESALQRAEAEGGLPVIATENLMDLVAHLKKPRKVIILVQAGRPVDDTISILGRYMEPGDVIVDGGDEWYPNSLRRAKFLEPKGIHFMGIGISGGEGGARQGPSIMAGGPKNAYDLVEPILAKVSAKAEESGACIGYLGPVGAGHYVHMVHNGIEYGDMQMIAEAYDVLKNVLGMDNEEIANVFDEWNNGELASYLFDMTAKILRKRDEITGEGYVLDYILDKTGMKGTGMWTIKEGAENGVAIPILSGALEARKMSHCKEERKAAELLLKAPAVAYEDKGRAIEDLSAALFASKLCSYAQGLRLIKTASDEYKWNVNLAECARVWMGGCIIRANLIKRVFHAYSANESLASLLVDPDIARDLNDRSIAWRRLVALCITNGIACPALSGSLTYFDSCRRGLLPANLTQAQRDFFGGHSYKRVDRPGNYHTSWTMAHKDIGDVSERTAGENLLTNVGTIEDD